MTRVEPVMRRINTDPGQTLVEMALVLPLLLLAIFGIVQFGLAAFYVNDEKHLASTGARFAAVNRCADCGGATVNAFLPSLAGTGALRDNATIRIAFVGSARNHCEGSGSVKVTVSYPMTFSAQVADIATLNLHASETMRLEKDWNGDPVSGHGSPSDAFDVEPGSASPDACV